MYCGSTSLAKYELSQNGFALLRVESIALHSEYLRDQLLNLMGKLSFGIL